MEKSIDLDPYMGERKYFGILLCNVSDTARYTKWPMIVQYNSKPEQNVALKFLIWIKFSKVSLANYALSQPGSADKFIENKYIVLKKIIPPFLLKEIQQCYYDSVKYSKVGGMDNLTSRYLSQNDRTSRLLLFTLVDLIRRSIAHNARPTFSYFSANVASSTLKPHTDRPQCEFVLLINIQQQLPSDHTWGLGINRIAQFEKKMMIRLVDLNPFPHQTIPDG